MGYHINQQWAEEELFRGCEAAEKVLDDTVQFKALLTKLESDLEELPLEGNALSNVPNFIRLLKDYKNRKYSDLSREGAIKIVSALLYVVNPNDMIPDSVPFVGRIDDALVVAACMKQVGDEVQAYLERR